MVKMLKQPGPKIDPNGKSSKSDNRDKIVIFSKTGGNGNPGRGAEMLKMLKQTGSKIDTIGKIAKRTRSLKWHSW